MNKIIYGLLSLGIVFLVGCAVTVEEASNRAKPKTTAVPDEIRTLPDGTKYLVHPNDILSGGPPKDGIPSLDNPKFTSKEEADEWLKDDDLVLGLEYNGVVRAYPHRIMNWHEIVNDVIKEERVLITYCPLCRTGIAFKPIVDNKEVEFGTSGKLYNSELVMYDRLTDSYWTQSLGKAIVGEQSGAVLEKVALDTVRWVDWKNLHETTEVLSRQTGHVRNYDSSPYGSIQRSNVVGFGLEFNDDRLGPKQIVYGVEFDNDASAYEEGLVETEKVINDVIGSVPIVVMWDKRLNTVKIFERTFDGEILEFSLEGNSIIDNSGKEWTVQDMHDRLVRVDTFGHFWFSWLSFFPETELYGV